MKNYQVRLEVWMAAAVFIIGLTLLLTEAKARNTAEAAPAAVKYRLNTDQSKFTVRAFVGGLLSAFGHDHTIAIRDFTGEAEVTPGSLAPGSLYMTIKTDSLAVTDKVSASDRQKIETTMRQEVLEADKYPEIVFRSTRVEANQTGDGQYQAKISGELTLHGVTRDALITAQVTVSGDTLRARGAFPIRQTEYGIKPVSVAGGTIKVKDELKLSFDIVAHKQ